MLRYILKRLLNLIPVAIIISIMIFAVGKAMPGDPVSSYLGMGSKVPPEQREEIREQLGLNDPVPVQYVNWITRFVSGDLGDSIKYQEPVAELIGPYIWNTFLLNLVAMIVAILVSIPIGIKQAVKKYSKFDNFWTVFSLLGISIPSFFFALVLIFFVALNLGLPISGMRDPILSGFGYESFFAEVMDVGKHMILPVIVLAFSSFSTLSRYVRNSMIDVINQDYIRTARSKGLKEKVVIYHHAFRNALIPLVTLLGIYIPALFSGAVVLESVFNWPGIGNLLVESIFQKDLSIVNATLMFSAILVLLGNLLADVLYSIVDPRIKTE